MDRQAGIIDRWFGETVIHSDKRFTYEDAQEVLDKQDGVMLPELNILRDLARLMRTRREKNGAIAFDTPEVKVLLDEEKKPIGVVLKERKETNLLIEDFMLLANVAVAEHISEIVKKNTKLNFIYRVHDTPDRDRIEDLAQFLRVLGYTLDTNGGVVSGAEINELLRQVEGKPEEYLVKMSTLRSMAKATYTTKNVGHFGLAFTHYTHFTSPIRRYPDLIVHRMVKCVTAGVCPTDDEMARFEELAIHSSEREVRATEAERDSIKLKQVEYLEPRIGEEFDAVISGVSDRGMFVELTETRAEGMISVRNIGDDYFVHDQKRYRLVGERSKKTYALGDPIRVKLIAARVLERELDFALVETN
jgi:ribonuclease R